MLQTRKHPPGPGGAAAFFRGINRRQENPLKVIQELRDNFGNIIYIDFFIRKVYLVFEPEYIRQMLSEKAQNYRKSSQYEKAELFLGQGMLNSEGTFWKRQRKLAQPAFLKSQVNHFHEMMLKHCNQVISEWRSRGDKNIDVHSEMMRLTMNIIADAMFSMNLNKEASNIAESLSFLNEYASERIRSNFVLPVLVPTLDNLKFLSHSGRLNRLMYSIIEQRRKTPVEEMPKDLLTALVLSKDPETGETMSDLELRDELMTIFLAGHETTAMAMTMFFYNLTRNKPVLTKVLDEVRNTDIQSSEDLQKLTYTSMALQENLRLNPPAWVIGRRAIEDETLGDYYIQKDVDISMPIMILQRSPEYYERPLDFYPEHFSDAAIKARPRYTYLPFGAGPRICIGKSFAEQEMMLIAWSFLKNLDLESQTGQIELEPLFTLRPRQKILMRAKKAP